MIREEHWPRAAQKGGKSVILRIVPLLLLLLVCALPCDPLLASHGAEAYLSDTPWRTGLVYSVFDPAYGRLSPEVRRNTNFHGQPLTIDGVKYPKGFGCRLYSIIEYAVPPEAGSVEGIVGIDDATGRATGDTYFSIWGDGQRLWQSPALSRDDPAVRFTVPVSGIRQIKLISDGQGYGNGDLANWCEVRWRTDQPASPAWHYVPRPASVHVRAEVHPFHLVYRGESIPVAVVAGRARVVEVRCTVLDESDIPIRETTLRLELTGDSTRGFAATGPVPLRGVPNGLYQLKLLVTADGNRLAERTVRFGLIESHLGKPIQGSIYGVNHHEFVSSYEPLAAAGVEWSRQWFCWAWIEPTNDDWRWSWHDERVAAAQEFGIKTIGVLGGIGQPEWSSPGTAPKGYKTTHGCPTDMAEWEEYVRAVATRYRGKVKVWESWNEIQGFADNRLYGWAVEKYVDLHRRTWRVLKEVAPENILLVSADSLGFVGRCLQAGLGNAYDGIVIHPYRPDTTPEARCVNDSVGRTGDLLAVFLAAREWLNVRNRPDAQVWATEIGWGLIGSGWAGPWSRRRTTVAICRARSCWRRAPWRPPTYVGTISPRACSVYVTGMLIRGRQSSASRVWSPGCMKQRRSSAMPSKGNCTRFCSVGQPTMCSPCGGRRASSSSCSPPEATCGSACTIGSGTNRPW